LELPLEPLRFINRILGVWFRETQILPVPNYGNSAGAGALRSVMAVALLSYFGTMVAALVGLILLLNSFLASSVMQRVRTQPHPMPAIEQTAARVPDKRTASSEKQPGPWGPAIIHASTEGAKAADGGDTDAAKQAPAEKNKRLKIARDQTRSASLGRNDASRKEDLAGRRQDQEYSTALRYAQEAQQQPASGPLFDLFGPRRF
jgi:hypothetical protein